jgi:hypothetical protein
MPQTIIWPMIVKNDGSRVAICRGNSHQVGTVGYICLFENSRKLNVTDMYTWVWVLEAKVAPQLDFWLPEYFGIFEF